SSAIPAMKVAMDDIETRGRERGRIFRPGFLFYAYAKSAGRDAFPRLWKMIKDPKLRSAQYSLDNAVALALGLTSYVDDLRPPSGVFLCRFQEPRDALDDVVLAWEQG